MTRTTRSLIAVTAATVLALAGCSSSKDSDETSAAASSTASTTTTEATTTETMTSTTSVTEKMEDSAGEFHLHDGYVKAGEAGGMTAIFGILENHADKPVQLVSFTTTADAEKNEIHEVIDGKMQEMKDGITIGADSKQILKPGGEHLMLIGLPKALEAGSSIDITFTFADGSEVVIDDVPVRQMAAGNEEYSSDHADHKHSDHKDGEHKDGDHSTEGSMTMAPTTAAQN